MKDRNQDRPAINYSILQGCLVSSIDAVLIPFQQRGGHADTWVENGSMFVYKQLDVWSISYSWLVSRQLIYLSPLIGAAGVEH